MNELDVVRVKETVMAKPWFEDDPMEIQSGWEGTIEICKWSGRFRLKLAKGISPVETPPQ